MLKTCAVFLLFVLPCFSQVRPRSIAADERAALISLFNSTNGPQWKDHAGWLGAPGTECDWYGVECAYQLPDRHITGISLSENNLVGAIPEELSALTHLESLNFVGDKLTGRIPKPLIRLAQTGSLSIAADASLLTDVTEIDVESSASALLCARDRFILRADGSIGAYATRCRNASPNDRVTFCEVKHGRSFSFAPLAWLIEKNGFYAMQKEYSRNITDAGFVQTRVRRGDRTYEISDYAGGGPLDLFGIEMAIQGVASATEWTSTTRQSKCPRW